MAARVSQLDQYLNLIKNPADPSTYQEVLEVKQNIIKGLSCLLRETKPLSNNQINYHVCFLQLSLNIIYFL